MGFTQTFKIDLPLKEIEEKIVALEGNLVSALEVDIHTYYHKSVSFSKFNFSIDYER